MLSRCLALLSCLVLIFTCCVISRGDEWPQWRGPSRDGTWRETGIIDKFPKDGIKILWRQPIASGYSGPTVADGRVYVTDRVVEPTQIERVHCFDEKDGQPLWSFKYDCPYSIGYEAGPRASVTIDDGRAFALGAMGHLHCFEAGTGAVLWKKDLNDLYKIRMPIWGIAASPLIYEDLVILQIGGNDDACIVALNKKNGEEKWRALRDRAQYSAPILIEQAGQSVLVCWTGDSVAGLDPATGKVHWRHPFTPTKMPIGIATPIVENDRLFVTSFYDGALMLGLRQDKPAVDKLWQRRGLSERDTEALQSIISTPLFIGDQIYGVDSYGELRCLDAATGDRIWEDLTATPKARWSNIHFVRNGDRVWMFNERGELIISKLSPSGFDEISRAKLIDPTFDQLRQRGGVCWAHPAFANKHIFARNDKEIVCASLEAK
jgi:outer membrane protein assembly factor BamB